MEKEIIGLIITAVVLMIGMRLLFSEFDGRTASTRMNLAYFLNFERKFTYKKMKTTFVTILICCLIFGGVSLFSTNGILLLGIFICVGMIADILSSYVYHCYGKYRFRKKIAEVRAYVDLLKAKIESPSEEEDIYEVNSGYDFAEVAERYIVAEDHMACLSQDGGEWFSQMPRYSQVSFLVDSKVEEANARFIETPIRVTTMTKDNKYPFKDQKIDTLVCYNENFNPTEAKRVLKEDGTLILNQKGSENLIELYAFTGPYLFKNQWNLNFCEDGLRSQNYQILDGQESRGEIRFRTVSSFYHFVKDQTLLKIDQVEDYINQFFFIDQVIQKNGFFAMKTHHFYVVAKKNN